MVYWSEGSTSIVISQISASDIIQEEILFVGGGGSMYFKFGKKKKGKHIVYLSDHFKNFSYIAFF